MLYYIIAWTVLFIICFVLGTLVLDKLTENCFAQKSDYLIAAIWLGISLLSAGLLFISLFLPLSLPITLPITFILIPLCLSLKSVRQKILDLLTIRTIISWLIITSAIALFMAKEVTWYDSGLYHIGKIRWLAEYGTVPGLYLIQDRFGWNSSWFAVSAFLNPPFIDYRGTVTANGFLVVITLVHFSLSIKQIAQGTARLATWFAAIAYLILLPILLNPNLPLTNTNQQENTLFLGNQTKNLIAKLVISPSPDIPIILITIIIAWSILLISDKRFSSSPSNALDIRLIPLLLAGGAISIKLTGAALMLVAFPFYCLKKRFWWQRQLWGILLSLILLIPTFGSGIITSACPIFPSLFMCLELPWSTYPPYLNDLLLWWKAESLLGNPSGEEKYWWWLLSEWVNKSNINQIISFYLIVTLILLIWLVIYHRDKLAGTAWVLLLGLVGMSFILSQAPDTRYGLGYFLLIPCVTMGAFCYCLTVNSPDVNLTKKLSPFVSVKSISLPRMFHVFIFSFITVLSLEAIKQSSFLLPPPLPQVPVFRDKVNKIKYFQPSTSLGGDICWASELPCSHGFLPHSVKLWKPERGIRGGFKGRRPKSDWTGKR